MRLIDADAYSKKVCTYNETGCGSCNVQIICPFDEPTIDATPVRHGKWLPENRTMDAFWVCSCCGFPSEAHGAFKIYKFCPNCGARMDAE